MIKKRVAISGKMTSGKTTCSEHLIQRYGYKRISFAAPIKKIVEGWFYDYSFRHTDPNDKVALENRLFYMLVEIFDGDYTKANAAMDILLEDIFPRYMDIDWTVPKNDKWRKCLQEVGGGRIRAEIDDNVWINHAMRQLNDEDLYILDDLRYKNEFQILADNGFLIVRLDVSSEVQIKRVQQLYGNVDPERLKHSSETDLDDVAFPYTINADKELIWVLHDLISIVEGEE